MSTFRKVEIVDARKFEGGIPNGSELVFWVSSGGGKAEQHISEGIDYIRVYEHRESRKFDMAFPGDWIERRQNGEYQVTRQQVIDTYEEV
ncbi:hypothetical protein PBI_SHEPARD_71 [Arthrobacter phage Shepard]|nr:hypothetical protein PBI_SHEPARD_71 [Arthrobacter phage Shepard]